MGGGEGKQEMYRFLPSLVRLRLFTGSSNENEEGQGFGQPWFADTEENCAVTQTYTLRPGVCNLKRFSQGSEQGVLGQEVDTLHTRSLCGGCLAVDLKLPTEPGKSSPSSQPAAEFLI